MADNYCCNLKTMSCLLCWLFAIQAARILAVTRYGDSVDSNNFLKDAILRQFVYSRLCLFPFSNI